MKKGKIDTKNPNIKLNKDFILVIDVKYNTLLSPHFGQQTKLLLSSTE
jgi:hypothetical protein